MFLEISHLLLSNCMKHEFDTLSSYSISDTGVTFACFFSGAMDELQSLDPRRQELLEARFMGGISGSTGSTGSTSGGTKVTGSITYNPSFFPPLYKLKQNGIITAITSVVSDWNTSGSE